MSRKTPTDNSQVFEEASAWFVEFRTPGQTDATRLEFHDWLKRSPEHIRAYLEIAATYAQMPAPEGELVPAELIASANAAADGIVVPLTSKGAVRPSSVRAPTAPSLRLAWGNRLVAPLAAVAAAASIILVGLGIWFFVERNTYETAIGEQRSLTLEDGSVVELNALSRIRIAYTPAQRSIELQSGQALFRVAKNPARPFIVSSGNAVVRAVGTEFDVYRKTSGTTVTVIEGRVRVGRDESARDMKVATTPSDPQREGASITGASMNDGPDIVLAAGEQMTVTPRVAQKVRSPNIPAATAWTQHQLLFDATPLSEVVEEFNRYNRRSIVIDTPELGHLTISGQYTSTNTDSLVRFLRLQSGIKIVETGPAIHIARE